MHQCTDCSSYLLPSAVICTAGNRSHGVYPECNASCTPIIIPLHTWCSILRSIPAAPSLPGSRCTQAAAHSIKRWRGKQLHDWRAAKGSKDWQRLQRELHRFFAVHCVLHKSGDCLGLSLPQFSALMKLTRITDEELPLEVRICVWVGWDGWRLARGLCCAVAGTCVVFLASVSMMLCAP